jgi:putative membrane protein
LAAAPLLVASRPLAALTWALPVAWRRGLGAASHTTAAKTAWRLMTDPMVATTVQGAVLWIWHLPGLFDLALAHEAWHAAQHLCFFVSALLFWSAMIGTRRSAWMAALCLFATSLITGALGGFMALSASPWYAAYASLGFAPWGLTPTEDQQLAGLLMWLPGGAFHAVVAAMLLSGKLRESQRT